ncbi:MAG: phosphate/phosphite/phosphonate ABC transporter substrate-binding protein [Devosiaceae bacterium]
MTVKKVTGFLAILAIFAAVHSARAETLTLGTVHENPRKQITILTPLAQYLQAHLTDHGITQVDIAVLTDSTSMAQAMRDGEVDLYFDSPVVASHVGREANATPVLQRWRDGNQIYRSLIIVEQASRFQTVADLDGATIAFEEEDSSSGYLLPAALILQWGLNLRALNDLQETPRDGEVGYLETHDDRNSILWLANGLVSAAAVDQQSWSLLNQARPGEFRVLSRSMFVPREVVMQRNALDPTLAGAIQDTMLGMADTPEGTHAMAMFDETTRFDHFPYGVRATFTPIHDVLDALSQARMI